MYYKFLQLLQDCPGEGPDSWLIYFLSTRDALLFLIYLGLDVELEPLTIVQKLT